MGKEGEPSANHWHDGINRKACLRWYPVAETESKTMREVYTQRTEKEEYNKIRTRFRGSGAAREGWGLTNPQKVKNKMSKIKKKMCWWKCTISGIK